MEFKVTDIVQMKSNIKGIDTFGIVKHKIREYRNKPQKVRYYKKYEDGSEVLKFYGKDSLSYWNAKMFELKERDNY